MGWFDEQIRQRIQNDNDSFAEAFADMASVIMGKGAMSAALNDASKQAKDAISDILRFYRVAPQELPDSLTDVNEQLEFLLRPSGIMRRDITLSGNWYKDGIGALLGTTKDGRIIALIPRKISGYEYFDIDSGKRVKVDKRIAAGISPDAICFYKPFPLRELSAKDLFRYILGTLAPGDIFMILLTTLAVSLIGLISAYANNVIFSQVISGRRMSLLYAALVLLVGITVSTQLINIAKSLILSKIQTKMIIAVESASMMRVLSLPADFFKKYSAGDLANRVKRINNLCTSLSSTILTTGLSSVFSVIYVFQIFHYAPALLIPVLVIILLTVLLFSISSVLQVKELNREMQCSAKESGLVFSLLSSIQKIKLSGAEKRAFAKWSRLYRQTADSKYNPNPLLKITNALITVVTFLGTAAIYYFAVATNVSVSEFMAFDVAYGMVSGAFFSFIMMSMDFAQIKPTLNIIKPILKAVPEISQGKKVVTRLSGGIELNNVSFRYSENMPLVIDNLSLKIRPGQYLAIVGSTGCGKSTLMRLMLGFETPQKGAIYYDGVDISALDLKSLRRNIGTVMQNGKLFSGDVYSNIVISAPWLGIDDAWHAAEMAGIADDIRHMPMGMHTIISEGSGGISGGQRQRMMIARAIAPKPRILMFDEATSALDNITQKTVSQSLDNLKCTRIVIAHRLSTIKQCDRIIVLDKGKIVEDGTYDNLIQKGGFFATLVERQRLDSEPAPAK
jgi:NHLM bacteriocin system ABC transporter ATP-binding protein